jgi:hypothetical protein
MIEDHQLQEDIPIISFYFCYYENYSFHYEANSTNYML